VTIQKEVYISELVSKLNKYEAENQSIMKRSRALESEMTKYSDELSVKNSIIRRLETDFESKLSRAKEELAKNPDLSRDILEENRRLLEKSRVWEK
jgi:predicted  nucleic acid-binding Zn-ribbon protein